LKAHGIAGGFVLEGKTVRLPLSFEHESELKLLNEKQTTYKLHSYLNEKNVGKCLLLPTIWHLFFPPHNLEVVLIRAFVLFSVLKGQNVQIMVFCNQVALCTVCYHLCPLKLPFFSGVNLSLLRGWLFLSENITQWNNICSTILLCYDLVNIVLELYKTTCCNIMIVKKYYS
jgi:hypothetical protein